MENNKNDFLTWKIPAPKDEKYLRNLARDIYENKVFTSNHIPQHSISSITMIFMPLIFMVNDIFGKNYTEEDRDAKLLEMERFNRYDEYFTDIFNKTGKTENDLRKEFYESIGMYYEYYTEQAPSSINGFPIFYSMRYISIDDSGKVSLYYKEYKEHIEKWNT